VIGGAVFVQAVLQWQPMRSVKAVSSRCCFELSRVRVTVCVSLAAVLTDRRVVSV